MTELNAAVAVSVPIRPDHGLTALREEGKRYSLSRSRHQPDVLLVCLLVVCSTVVVLADTHTSIASGPWSSGATWDKGALPHTGDNVVIASPHTVTVTANVAEKVNNVTIDNGATLACGGPYGFSFGGDWINNGTFNCGTGTVTDTMGLISSNTTIGGTKPTTFYKLVIVKDTLTSTVTLNSDVTISQEAPNALVIKKGTLITNGKNLDVSGTTASVAGDGTLNGRLVINNGSVVNIFDLNQGAGGVGYVHISGDNTVVNIARTHTIGYRTVVLPRCDILGGRVNYTATGSVLNLNLDADTYNDAYGWYASGGVIKFYGSIRAGYPFLYAYGDAVMIFAGNDDVTWTHHLFSYGPLPCRYAFNDIRIQKSDGRGVLLTARLEGAMDSIAIRNLTVSSGNTFTMTYSGFRTANPASGWKITNVRNDGAIVHNSNGWFYSHNRITNSSWTGSGSFTQGNTHPVPSFDGVNMEAGAVKLCGEVILSGSDGLRCRELTQDSGTLTIAGSLTCSDKYLGNGSLTFNGTGDDTVAAVKFRTRDMAVAKGGGSITMVSDAAVDNNLLVNSGTLRIGEHVLTLGTDFASGNVSVGWGGVFSAVGTALVNARVTAASAAFPYCLEVANGGTIAARNAKFERMNQGGIVVGCGATVDSVNNFSDCTFDHGDIGGRMLKIENAQDLLMNNVNFEGSAAGVDYNVEKLANSGTIRIPTGTGTRWGESFENDPNSRIFWELSGVEEQSGSPDKWQPAAATIVRSVLYLTAGNENEASKAVLVDISGRRVMQLTAGSNDVSGLAPGVYHARSETGSRLLKRVVITR